MKTLTVALACIVALSSFATTREERLSAAIALSSDIIQECREQRLAGTLPGYAASVRCSNPDLRTAFAQLEYPHMGLIDRWLSYRVAVAGLIDAHALTESQAQARLAALTAVITTEGLHAVHPKCVYDNYLSPVPVAQRARLLQALPGLPLSIG